MSRSRYNYSPVANFGSNVIKKNPLEYCIPGVDAQFQIGTLGYLYGPYSGKCQVLTGTHCAKEWDSFCETMSQDKNVVYPNQVKNFMYPEILPLGTITAGQNLIRNSAFYKYCKVPDNCKTYEPFDPTDPNSPIIWYNTDISTYSKSCFPVCDVDLNVIDNDMLMDKVLMNPQACMDILLNIWFTAKIQGKIDRLMATKVGRFMAAYPNIFK